MNNTYKLANIFAAILLGIVLIFVVLPLEISDATLLNQKFDKLKRNNPQCLDYLQQTVAVPTWRFSLLSAGLFTVIMLALFLVSGYTLDTTNHYLGFWILFIMTTFFIYKTLGTRNYHYTCRDNCLKEWQNN